MSNSVNWFKLNRSLHRDIGYFCIGMTLIFAVSGIAIPIGFVIMYSS